MEEIYEDHQSYIKHLWIKIRWIITKGDLGNVKCLLLTSQLGSQGYFNLLCLSIKSLANRTWSLWVNYPDVGWENSPAVYKLSIRFLEYIEDYFLLDKLDMPTRNNTWLYLLLTYKKGLLDNITINGSLTTMTTTLWSLKFC